MQWSLLLDSNNARLLDSLIGSNFELYQQEWTGCSLLSIIERGGHFIRI
jgi:hypothetical protein